MPHRNVIISPVNRRQVLGGIAVTSLWSAPGLSIAADKGQGADSKLYALLERFAAQIYRDSPETAAECGADVGALKAKLDDRSSAAVRRGQERAKSMLLALRSITEEKLGQGAAIEAAACGWMLEADVGALDLPFPCQPTSPYAVSQMGGAHWSVPQLLTDQHGIGTIGDAEAYLARLEAYAVALDQESARLAHDSERGFRPPSFILDKAMAQVEAQARMAGSASPIVTALAQKLAMRHLGDRPAESAVKIMDTVVRPALLRQQAMLQKIRREATDMAGLHGRPAGEHIYELALRKTVTTAATPAELHRLGLDRVASVSAIIDDALKQRGMTQGSVADRLRALSRDPALLYPSGDAGREAILSDLRARLEGIRAYVPRITSHSLPPVEISRLPPADEVGAPYGWYRMGSPDGSRPGKFLINLRDPGEYPRWTLPTLVYHEAIPGHHVATSITNGLRISSLRKIYWFSAYDEGWAMYAEQLAEEFGLYADDPLARIGYLQDLLFRAVRLVVDTGIHALGWSREQAIIYYLSYLGKARSLAETEIDRYCVMPGQACSYLVGKEAWLGARDHYRAVAPSASLPRFHDAMLGNGPVPVGLLAGIARQRAGSSAKGI